MRCEAVTSFGAPLPNVLVADDDAGFRRVTALLLRRLGYPVLTVDNVYAARRAIETRFIGLVLTDIVMPGDGLRLVESAVAAALPVIAVSGSPGAIKSVRRLSLGRHATFACFAKPVDFDVLLRCVRHFLSESSESRSLTPAHAGP